MICWQWHLRGRRCACSCAPEPGSCRWWQTPTTHRSQNHPPSGRRNEGHFLTRLTETVFCHWISSRMPALLQKMSTPPNVSAIFWKATLKKTVWKIKLGYRINGTRWVFFSFVFISLFDWCIFGSVIQGWQIKFVFVSERRRDLWVSLLIPHHSSGTEPCQIQTVSPESPINSCLRCHWHLSGLPVVERTGTRTYKPHQM